MIKGLESKGKHENNQKGGACMRRVLITLLALALVSPAFAALDVTSFRMDGINPQLAGVVEDEYSDIFVNGANLLDIEGWRVYTNLSNLTGKAETALGAAPAAPTNFTLGAIGNPLARFLPGANFGALYDQTGQIALTAAGNPLGGTGRSEVDTVAKTDVNNNGYGDNGDTLLIQKQIGDEYTEIATLDYDVLAAYPLMNDSLRLGLSVEKRDFVGIPGAINIAAGDRNYVYDEELDYALETIGHATQPKVSDVSDSTVHEDTLTNCILANLGAQYQLMPNLRVGLSAGMNMAKLEQKRDAMVNLHFNNGKPGAATLDNTQEVATTDDLTGGYVNPLANQPAGSPGLSGAIVARGTLQIDNDGDGAVDEDPVDGLDNDADGLIDEDPAESVDVTQKGIGFQTGVDCRYGLSDAVTLVGLVQYAMLPLDIDGTYTNSYEETILTTLAGTYMGLGGGLVDDKGTTTMLDETTVTGTGSNNAIGVTVGTEAKLQDNLKVGAAVSWANTVRKTEQKLARSLVMDQFYDQDHDGEIDDATDQKMKVTHTDEWKNTTENKTNTIRIPVGLEYDITEKIAFRLGVTHTIQTQRNTAKSELVSDSRWEAVNTNASFGDGNTDDVGDPWYLDTDDDSGAINETKQDPTTTRTTVYSYGLGFNLTDNLTIDVLNFASGADILDLGAWNISATLKF